MDKEAIFQEFKKNKETKEVKQETVINEEPEVIKGENKTTPVFKNNKNKKRKNKKNKTSDFIKVVEKTENKYEEWKKDFLSKDVNKEFISLLEFYRTKNFNIFSDEEFLQAKFKHPLSRTVILDPTLNDINAGKGGDAYIIKPLYMNEYNYFIRNVGPRDEKPEEFIQYAIEKCVLYPEMTKEKLDIIGAGSVIALYKYILEFSDLTKTIRVLEV